MSLVLVVDDSPTDRIMACRFLQQEPDLTVTFACDGNEALARIREQLPDAVVTDLQMPECDGLQLVDLVMQEFPRLPVILMTAKGSEDVAVEALRRGAASYVPKRVMATQLRDTVVRILSAASNDGRQSRLMHSLAESQLRFEIQNDPELIETLTEHIQGMLRCLPLGDESERLRVVLAVKHALWNGLYHGNLELPLDLEDLRSADVVELIQARLSAAPYADRMLTVEMRISPQEAAFLIRHEGPGFPPEVCRTEHADPCCPRHFTRGIVLMQSIMDETQILEDGHAISTRKRPSADQELLFEA
ncbi:MAG: response regulator [Planctomycetes bacterium]|nr:response regulator [Planctomycetota bacterium]